uniref:NADH dehydrogenase subunit 4 n=1 Tax=Leofa pulchella TaxID=1671235 RepID=UPI002435C9A3|nr:NADH dehydrogenase subunit 4 [Leofa pulchella]WEU77777.1 NADH dehydrogenase subunit 4 [Leofa pulchella]
MMKFIMFILFMTPLCKNHLIIVSQVGYLLAFMFSLILGANSFFSSISYFIGLDNFSYMMLMLGFLICSYMIISMMGSSWMNFFLLMNLSLNLCLMLIFLSMNIMYMYISFEFVLIPLMILILGWGYQPERLVSGLYLFFYTVLVSLPLFIILIYLYMNFGSLFFDLMMFDSYFFVFHFFLMMVFMVKMPMYFVHFWLPKAHVQAPVSGSMILAGLMLKIGGYGLVRVMTMFEYMYLKYSYIWFSLSLLGSVYISMVCLIQADMKCMIAYSSVSHMGMVIMGLMGMSKWGLIGSYFLMIAHGFCSSGMFYMCNLFYLRTLSRSFYINKGLMMYMPSCSMFWFLLCAFNMSCPPSLNFLSELMILTSMMNFWFNSVYYFVLISFLCACFSFFLYSYSQHGLYHSNYSFSSLNLAEFNCIFMHLIPLIMFSLMLTSMF